jgi:hypothetical protein
VPRTQTRPLAAQGLAGSGTRPHGTADASSSTLALPAPKRASALVHGSLPQRTSTNSPPRVEGRSRVHGGAALCLRGWRTLLQLVLSESELGAEADRRYSPQSDGGGGGPAVVGWLQTGSPTPVRVPNSRERGATPARTPAIPVVVNAADSVVLRVAFMVGLPFCRFTRRPPPVGLGVRPALRLDRLALDLRPSNEPRASAQHRRGCSPEPQSVLKTGSRRAGRSARRPPG